MKNKLPLITDMILFLTMTEKTGRIRPKKNSNTKIVCLISVA